MNGRVRSTRTREGTLGLLGLVALAHAVVLLAVGSMRAPLPALPSSLSPLIVELVRVPPPPPPPPPPPEGLLQSPSGGTPPPASSIHVRPQLPSEVPPEVAASVIPAPEPRPSAGVPEGSPSANTGSVTGSGSGTGRGSGSATGVLLPARWVRGATTAEILRAYPARALRANRSGRATLLCRIRLDGRLTDCQALASSPEGDGFDRAALTVSRHFRFEPSTLDGRPLDRREIVLEVHFDPIVDD